MRNAFPFNLRSSRVVLPAPNYPLIPPSWRLDRHLRKSHIDEAAPRVFLRLTTLPVYITRGGEKYRFDRRASVAQTSWSEQTGGPISDVFAGGLAILLDTLFRRGDTDIVVEKATRERTADGMARSDLSRLRSG